MKSIISKGLSWEWCLLGLLVTLLPFLYIKSESLDLHSHALTLQHLASLKELDVSVNDKLYEVYFGLIPDLDDLLTAQDNLARESHEFTTGLPEELQQHVQIPWEEYVLLLNRKLELVEGFKTNNAVLKNSVRYFPILSDELLAAHRYEPGPQRLIQLVDELRHELLLSGTNLGYDRIAKHNELLGKLQNDFPQLPIHLSGIFEAIQNHAKTIIRSRQDVLARIAEIRQIKTADKLDDIHAAYLSAFEAWRSETESYHTASFLVAGLLVLLIAFVLYKLKLATIRQSKLLNELKFQKFALDQHAIVSITDVKGKITYVNDKFCQISQYSEEELLGKNHRIIKSDEHSLMYFRDMWRTVARGEVWHGVFKNLARDGSSYWVSSTIVPFLNEQGKPFQYVSIRTDITPQIKAETELKLAHDQLELRVQERTKALTDEIHVRKEAERVAERANNIKSEFLANMSHELRTPMNGIIGMSHLALKTDLDTQQRHYIETVHDSANALLTILNDILDFSKIEAGKIEFEQKDFNLEAVIEKMHNLLKTKIEEKLIHYETIIDHDVPVQLVGDPLRLKQVLLNLAGNAIKFSRDGGSVRLLISIFEDRQEHIVLKFSMKDEGIGISKEQQKKIFCAFSQADSSTTRKYGGTGLGLVISRQLVELMQGNIELHSKPGEGSTFTFTAQFKKSLDRACSPDTTESGPMVQLQEAEALLRNCSLLLVEDNDINKEIALELLESCGATVVTAEDGQQALEILRQQTFDAVLMDCQMPIMDGYETTRRIRSQQQFKDLPVIAMTANTMQGDRDKAIAAGMNDYISKPIDFNQMILTLAQWLQPFDAQRNLG